MGVCGGVQWQAFWGLLLFSVNTRGFPWTAVAVRSREEAWGARGSWEALAHL